MGNRWMRQASDLDTMKLSIVHQTRYPYGTAVESSHHQAHLTPVNRPTQEVIQHTMDISPQSHGFCARTDAFGNTVTQWHMPFTHDQIGRAHV